MYLRRIIPIKDGAVFSKSRKYRYELWRIWDRSKPFCMFIGLNPSTADETKNDPTVRRCIKYARTLGFGSLCMTNLFAYRATDPKVMKSKFAPIGKRNNITLISLAHSAGIVILACGKDGHHKNRLRNILPFLPGVKCLGINQDETPKHPLYLKKTAKPLDYPTVKWHQRLGIKRYENRKSKMARMGSNVR